MHSKFSMSVSVLAVLVWSFFVSVGFLLGFDGACMMAMFDRNDFRVLHGFHVAPFPWHFLLIYICNA